jgi:hypothetical protein
MATEWTMELGHMAIFGDSGATGALRDPETEREIYEHILEQQQAEAEEDDDPVQVGLLQVINFYTGDVVAETEIWLCDEAHRHEHYDHNINRRGKFLAFESVRETDGSRFKVHIELGETVRETLPLIGACAYRGDVPGSAMEYVVDQLNTPDMMNSVVVERDCYESDSMSWREVLAMKPVTWTHPTRINVQMSMRNPHAVVVSAYQSGVALATNRTILKKIEKQ